MPEPALKPSRQLALDALAVFGIALAIRLLYVAWAAHHDPWFKWSRPGYDMNVFQVMADAFQSGDILLRRQGLFYFSPIFGYFCGIVYSVFGNRNFLAVHILQALMGAWAIGLAFIVARTWLGRAGAWFAGLALALVSPWLFYEQCLLHEGMMLFLYCAFLWGVRTGALGWRFKWARLIVAGMAAGIAALGRGNALLVLFAMAAWLLLDAGRRGSLKQFRLWGWKPAGALMLGTLIVLGSLVVRNYVVVHQWTLGMQNGKVLFYLGNAIDADGTFMYSPRFLDAHEGKKDYMGHFFEDLKQSPGHFVSLLGRKTFYFFRTQDLADNMNLQLGEKILLPLKLTPVRWWWLTPLGLIGLLLAAPRWRQWLPLWIFTAAFAVSLILIIPIGRYRAPVLLPIAIGAGFAVEWAIANWRARRREPVIAAAMCALILGAALGPWDYDRDRMPFIRSNDYAGGVRAALDSGMPPLALQICDWAMADYPPGHPFHFIFQNSRMQALVAAGRQKSPEALQVAETLLQSQQFSMDGALAAAQIYEANGRMDVAKGLAGAVLQNDPKSAIAKQILEK